MSVRINLTLEASEMFLSLHMIFNLEKAALVWAIQTCYCKLPISYFRLFISDVHFSALLLSTSEIMADVLKTQGVMKLFVEDRS